MSLLARLVVTTGPDRGKLFDMTEELIHIGKGAENQIVLTDPALAEHQMSIVRRNDRYAIYTPTVEGIEVEGNPIPPQRWVWLPDEALIQLTSRTALKFVYLDGSDEAVPAAPASTAEAAAAPADASRVKRPATDAPTPAAAKPKRLAGNRAGKKGANVARFITDGPGDPLVKLGEDGHLPELRLNEGEARDKRDSRSKQSNPLLLIVGLGVSFCLSLLMLFADIGSIGGGTLNKTQARRQVADYFGGEKETLKPYQIALRQAQQAHTRRDYDAERQEYRKVLDLLRAEGRNKFTGLTGTPESDERLERLIAVLLSE